MEREEPHLKRALGLYATTAIVIGAVVGSGIFSKPAGMAQALPSAPILLAVWLFTGVLTLFGALTQSELVGMMPKSGGLYQYFRAIYGEKIGFMYGWANFMIAGSGAIAAIAYVFAIYADQFVALPHFSQALEKTPLHIPVLGDIFPFDSIGIKLVGAVVVILLTWVNVRGVKLGGTLQSISTTSKIVAILAVVAIAFVAGGSIGSSANWSSVTEAGRGLSGWTMVGAIAAAMSGAFWAYDGWGNASYIAEEVKNPTKNVPRALILGTFIFVSLYMLVNLAYFYILPIDQVAAAPEGRVASTMVAQVIGPVGALLIAALIMLSTFDTVNASILANARVYYAMAEHKIFYKPAGDVHPQFRTPHVALMMQGGWSLVLLFSGSFDLIADMYVFVNWTLYVLLGLGVFIMRKRAPDAERPFRVPGYPWVPGIFILFALAYVIITLVTDIQSFARGEQPLLKSVTGIALVVSGLPFYYWWKRKYRGT